MTEQGHQCMKLCFSALQLLLDLNFLNEVFAYHGSDTGKLKIPPPLLVGTRKVALVLWNGFINIQKGDVQAIWLNVRDFDYLTISSKQYVTCLDRMMHVGHLKFAWSLSCTLQLIVLIQSSCLSLGCFPGQILLCLQRH